MTPKGDLEKKLHSLAAELEGDGQGTGNVLIARDRLLALLLEVVMLEQERCIKIVDHIFNVENDEYYAVYPEQIIKFIRDGKTL